MRAEGDTNRRTLDECFKSMHKDCGSCSKFAEHVYWVHRGTSPMHFLRRMNAGFSQSMNLPNKFVIHFKDVISKTVDLKAPSGHIWHVGVEKIESKLVLHSGWEDFVTAHDIVENDLLLFKYKGSSSFDVLIFDTNGYEKASAFFVEKKSVHQQQNCEDSVEILSGLPLREVVECSSGRSADDHIPRSPPPPELPRKASRIHHASPRPKKSDTRPGKDVKEEDIMESAKFELRNSRTCYVSKNLQLTEEQQKKAMQLALAVQPGNPYCVEILPLRSVSDKGYFMDLPREFAGAHLPHKSQQIVLMRPNRNRKWHVRYFFSSYRRGINRYWKAFANDNNLRVGQVCIFELMKKRKIATLTVHVHEQ